MEKRKVLQHILLSRYAPDTRRLWLIGNYRMNNAIKMTMGMGTPSSKSRIERIVSLLNETCTRIRYDRYTITT